MTTDSDPLHGFSPDEIIVGPDNQTLTQAAAEERPAIMTPTQFWSIVDGAEPPPAGPILTEIDDAREHVRQCATNAALALRSDPEIGTHHRVAIVRVMTVRGGWSEATFQSLVTEARAAGWQDQIGSPGVLMHLATVR